MEKNVLGDTEQSRVVFFLKRLLNLEVLLFGFFLIYCFLRFLDALEARKNPFVFSGWMLVRDLMIGPSLLLSISVLMLIRRVSTVVLAMAIALYLIYVTGFRFLLAIPYSHDVSLLSLDAVKLWFEATPSNLLLQTALATVTLILGQFNFGVSSGFGVKVCPDVHRT